MMAVCFSHRVWGPAPQGQVEQEFDRSRPCVEVIKLWEDGSFRARVFDAGGPRRYVVNVGAEDR